MLTATFVRHRGENTYLSVLRSDGSELELKLATNGDALPRELVHLVVEDGLGMLDGFWGLIDRGADATFVNSEAAVASVDGPGDGVQRGYVIPASYIPPELIAIRLRLSDLQRDWAALADRGSITLSFG